MSRWMTVIAAGLAMTACLGLVGLDAASAASPALHIKQGAVWSVVVNGERSFCEQLTFSSWGTFAADRYNDSGTWTGGGKTITVNWTAGSSSPSTFTGTFRTTPVGEYKGVASFMGYTFSVKLIEGALAGC